MKQGGGSLTITGGLGARSPPARNKTNRVGRAKLNLPNVILYLNYTPPGKLPSLKQDLAESESMIGPSTGTYQEIYRQ